MIFLLFMGRVIAWVCGDRNPNEVCGRAERLSGLWPTATLFLQNDSNVCPPSLQFATQSASHKHRIGRKNDDVWNCLWRRVKVRLYIFLIAVLNPMSAFRHSSSDVFSCVIINNSATEFTKSKQLASLFQQVFAEPTCFCYVVLSG